MLYKNNHPILVLYFQNHKNHTLYVKAFLLIYLSSDNLSSNNSNSEADNKFIDIVSNGFKLRRSDVLNESGDPYIYIAFAEEPLVANVGASIPATAR